MAYRYDDKPPKPEDHLLKLSVRNGATARISLACYYPTRPHETPVHDYLGWPNPDKPDSICQVVVPWRTRQLDRRYELNPIDLAEEGYDEINVAWETTDDTKYLSEQAWFDEESPNIIRLSVKTSIPEFSDKPKDFRFTVFIRRSGDGRIDSAFHGMLTVLPGKPYQTK